MLRGKQLRRLQEAGHHQLSTYGIGKDKSDSYWHNIINQLVHKGLIRVDITAHAALRLTEAARPVLKGEVDVQLAVPRLEFKPDKKKRSKRLPTTTEPYSLVLSTYGKCWQKRMRCRPTWYLVTQP